MDNTDNNNKNTDSYEEKHLRKITADSNNTSRASRSLKREDPGLDFEFDFMKKQTGLHPESRGLPSDGSTPKNRGLEPTIVYGENKGLVPQEAADTRLTRDTIDLDDTQVYRIRTGNGEGGKSAPAFTWRDATHAYDLKKELDETEAAFNEAAAFEEAEFESPDAEITEYADTADDTEAADIEEVGSEEISDEDSSEVSEEGLSASESEDIPVASDNAESFDVTEAADTEEAGSEEISDEDSSEISEEELSASESEDISEAADNAETADDTEASDIEVSGSEDSSDEDGSDGFEEGGEEDEGTEVEESAVELTAGYVLVNRKGLSGKVKQTKNNNVKAVSAASVNKKRPAKAKSGGSTGNSKTGNSNKKAGSGQAPKAAAVSSSIPQGKSKKQKKKKVKKKRNKFVIFVRSLIITLISLLLVGVIAGGAYTAYVISHADVIHPDRIYDNLAVSTYIYNDKDKLIDEVYYSENRQITTYE